MRYNLVSIKACLDHLGSSRACSGSDFPRWSSSLAASLVLDTAFPGASVGARSRLRFFFGVSVAVRQLRSVLSPLSFPSNEDHFSTVPYGCGYRVHKCTVYTGSVHFDFCQINKLRTLAYIAHRDTQQLSSTRTYASKVASDSPTREIFAHKLKYFIRYWVVFIIGGLTGGKKSIG